MAYKFLVLAALRGRCTLLLRQRLRIYLTEMREGVAQRGTGDLYQPSIGGVQLQD